MGVKLLILLGLLVGVLYSLHLLAKDYQAISAPRLLRLLFKRDANAMNDLRSTHKPTVRWRQILQHDPIQCARYLYCDLGASQTPTELQRGFIYMLSLEPKEEDATALDAFVQAFNYGEMFKNTHQCRYEYPYCPFDAKLLFDLIQYLLRE